MRSGQRDDGNVGGAAAYIDDHVTGGLGPGQAGADRRHHRLLHQVHFGGFGAASMRPVVLKSVTTPFRSGRRAVMLPGVRPSISFASWPTASISPVFRLMATINRPPRTMPRRRA